MMLTRPASAHVPGVVALGAMLGQQSAGMALRLSF